MTRPGTEFRPWTEKERELLRASYEAEPIPATLAAVGERIGRSAHAVKTMAQRMELIVHIRKRWKAKTPTRRSAAPPSPEHSLPPEVLQLRVKQMRGFLLAIASYSVEAREPDVRPDLAAELCSLADQALDLIELPPS